MTARKNLIKNELASRVLYDESKGKQREADSLHALLTRLGFGCYRITSSESPDFFVSFKKDKSEAIVGCEVTNLYTDSIGNAKDLGSPGKRLLEKWKRIAKDLRHRLDETGLENIYGVLFFRDPSSAALDSCRPKQLMDELIDVCRKYRGNKVEIVFPIQGFPLLNELLTMLRLFQYPDTGILWWCAHLQSGEVPDPKDALISIVTRKIATARSYRWGNAVEKWLVVIAEATLLADTATEIDDPEIAGHFRSTEFTKIVLWDRFQDEVIEIFPIFRKLCDSQAETRNFKHYPQTLRPFIVGGSKYPTRIRGGS